MTNMYEKEQQLVNHEHNIGANRLREAVELITRHTNPHRYVPKRELGQVLAQRVANAKSTPEEIAEAISLPVGVVRERLKLVENAGKLLAKLGFVENYDANK